MNVRFVFSFLVVSAGVFLTAVGRCDQAALTTNPTADAFVATGTNGNFSGDNFGAAGALAIAAPGLPEGEFQTVMMFGFSGAATQFNTMFGAGKWTVQSMTLQLVSSPHNNAIFNPISAGQFNISLMQNNSWAEGTGTGGTPTTDGISFNSLQSTYINNATDQALGTFSFPGGSSGTNSYSLNLSSSLVADLMNGTNASFRFFAADSQISYLFSSRMNSSFLTPNLTIEVSSVPEPRSVAICALGLGGLLIGYYSRKIRR